MLKKMTLHILLLSLVFATVTLDAQYMDLMIIENNLFNGYGANHRPVKKSSANVMVEVELALSKIVKLDVSEEVLVTWLEFKVTWIDQRLQWDDLEYPGIRTMNVPRSKVWVPDLHVLRSAHKDSKLEGNDFVQISPNGKIQWNGEIETRTWCSMYVNKFPFDKQKCSISVSTLYHYEKDVNITGVNFTDNNVEMNASWKIKSVRAQRETFHKENKTKSGITLHFELHRHYLYYIYTVFMPIITVFGVNPFVFLVKAKSGEKISTGVTLFLSFTIFISRLSDMIPQTSNSVPFIFILVYIQFQMSAATVIICILSSRQSCVKKPKWFTKLFECVKKCMSKRKIIAVAPAETGKDAVPAKGTPKDEPLDENLLEDKTDRKFFLVHFIMTLLLIVSTFLFLML